MHELGPLVATALLGCVASYYLGKAVERWSSQKGRADDRSAWAAELEEKQQDLLDANKRLQDAGNSGRWASLLPKCRGCGVIDWQWCDRDVESVDRSLSFLDTLIEAQGADYEYQ
jgi:hypothetical protein